jgi:DNA polymerase III subunit beta
MQVDRKELEKAFDECSRAISNRATLPVLSGVRLKANDGKLELTATDLELTIRSSIEADGNGVATITPGRLTGTLIKKLNGDTVTISAEEAGIGNLRLASGKAEFEIRSLSIDDYPKLDDPKMICIAVVNTKDLLPAIDRVMVAASKDESRQVLTGVCFEFEAKKVTLAATDSYRLMVQQIDMLRGPDTGVRVVVPARALRELKRIAKKSVEVGIYVGNQNTPVFFNPFQGTTLSVRPVEGDFPNYRQLIPDVFDTEIRLSRDETIEALDRVSLVAQNNLPVRFVFGDDGLYLEADTPDVGTGKEKLELAEIDGAPGTVAFNPDFVLQGLKSLPGKIVLMRMKASAREEPSFGGPVLFISDLDPGFQWLQMPVRLS